MSIITEMARAAREGFWDGYVPEHLPPFDELEYRECWLRTARAALAEAERLGWVLVPKEPTEGMIHSGGATYDYPSVFMGGPSHGGRRTSNKIYRAMIAARPNIEETP